jgi:hypothetical protein
MSGIKTKDSADIKTKQTEPLKTVDRSIKERAAAAQYARTADKNINQRDLTGNSEIYLDSDSERQLINRAKVLNDFKSSKESEITKSAEIKGRYDSLHPYQSKDKIQGNDFSGTADYMDRHSEAVKQAKNINKINKQSSSRNNNVNNKYSDYVNTTYNQDNNLNTYSTQKNSIYSSKNNRAFRNIKDNLVGATEDKGITKAASMLNKNTSNDGYRLNKNLLKNQQTTDTYYFKSPKMRQSEADITNDNELKSKQKYSYSVSKSRTNGIKNKGSLVKTSTRAESFLTETKNRKNVSNKIFRIFKGKKTEQTKESKAIDQLFSGITFGGSLGIGLLVILIPILPFVVVIGVLAYILGSYQSENINDYIDGYVNRYNVAILTALDEAGYETSSNREYAAGDSAADYEKYDDSIIINGYPENIREQILELYAIESMQTNGEISIADTVDVYSMLLDTNVPTVSKKTVTLSKVGRWDVTAGDTVTSVGKTTTGMEEIGNETYRQVEYPYGYDEDGNETYFTDTVWEVNISSLPIEDVAYYYGLDEDQTELLEFITSESDFNPAQTSLDYSSDLFDIDGFCNTLKSYVNDYGFSVSMLASNYNVSYTDDLNWSTMFLAYVASISELAFGDTPDYIGMDESGLFEKSTDDGVFVIGEDKYGNDITYSTLWYPFQTSTSVSYMKNWFEAKGNWNNKATYNSETGSNDFYQPQKGDVVFFSNAANGSADYVGIVVAVNEDGTFNYVYANTGYWVQQGSSIIKNQKIVGYASPNYHHFNYNNLLSYLNALSIENSPVNN